MKPLGNLGREILLGVLWAAIVVGVIPAPPCADRGCSDSCSTEAKAH